MILFVFAEPQYFRFEGVWLTEAGMALLRSLTLSPLQKKKPRRSRISTGGEIFLDGPEHGACDDRKEGDAECDEQKADGEPCWHQCALPAQSFSTFAVISLVNVCLLGRRLCIILC